MQKTNFDVFICACCGDCRLSPQGTNPTSCITCGNPSFIKTNLSSNQIKNIIVNSNDEFRRKKWHEIVKSYMDDDQVAQMYKNRATISNEGVLWRHRIKSHPHVRRQRINPDQQTYTPTCPTCHSPDIAKISSADRAGSVFLFGIFSSKINKQFECKNCGYKW